MARKAILLRLPEGLAERAKAEAARQERSLNALITAAVRAEVGEALPPKETA